MDYCLFYEVNIQSAYVFLLIAYAIVFAASLTKADIIILSSSESTVKQSFENMKFKDYIWNDLMRGMLGKQFPVLDVLNGNVIALPSSDGSQDGKWYFPISVVQKVTGK